MILAAGRGERMMPLTTDTPKPMLLVHGKPLLQHHIEKLKAAGITDIVINHAWCGKKIIDYFADGRQFGVNISYSDESSGALETAGGIAKALPLLVDDSTQTQQQTPFLVINGDIYCDYDFTDLPQLLAEQLGCLWLTANPAHNLTGDFAIADNLLINPLTDSAVKENTYTFSGISLYRAAFFQTITSENKLPLGPLLRLAATAQKLAAVKLKGYWADVGTPARLAQLNQCTE